MADSDSITQQQLKERLHYDPETGVFTWINPSPFAHRVKPGDKAGHLHKARGYVHICVLNILYKAHRLAWLYVKGQWPSEGMDHKNRIKSDNRIDNLREANQFENMQNKKVYCNNKSGYQGVHWHKDSNKWRASINVNRRVTHLGYFEDKKLASAAYAEAKSQIHTFHPEVS